MNKFFYMLTSFIASFSVDIVFSSENLLAEQCSSNNIISDLGCFSNFDLSQQVDIFSDMVNAISENEKVDVFLKWCSYVEENSLSDILSNFQSNEKTAFLNNSLADFCSSFCGNKKFSNLLIFSFNSCFVKPECANSIRFIVLSKIIKAYCEDENCKSIQNKIIQSLPILEILCRGYELLGPIQKSCLIEYLLSKQKAKDIFDDWINLLSFTTGVKKYSEYEDSLEDCISRSFFVTKDKLIFFDDSGLFETSVE